jgi:predicted HD superfamily hydrolase involved in NAD metabolism
MSEVLILEGTFDPVSAGEIRYAVSRLRQGYKDVWLQVQGEGVLTVHQRLCLLQEAVKPWRHLHAVSRHRRSPYAGKHEAMAETEEEAAIRQGNFKLCAPGTRRLLLANGWYFPEIVAAQCTAHRASHSQEVAELCRSLALSHDVDPALAWRTGMLHDITKKMNKEEARHLLTIYEPDKLAQNENIWHSYTAVIWLKQELGLYDRKMLRAIHGHTLGTCRSKLGMILYVADKCEPTRGYDSTREITLTRRDLKAGMKLVEEEALRYVHRKEDVNGITA